MNAVIYKYVAYERYEDSTCWYSWLSRTAYLQALAMVRELRP